MLEEEEAAAGKSMKDCGRRRKRKQGTRWEAVKETAAKEEEAAAGKSMKDCGRRRRRKRGTRWEAVKETAAKEEARKIDDDGDTAKQVCAVLFDTGGRNKYSVYVVDLSTIDTSRDDASSSPQPPPLRPVLQLDDEFPECMGFCVLGSKLYMFGGSFLTPAEYVHLLPKTVYAFNIPSKIPFPTTPAPAPTPAPTHTVHYNDQDTYVPLLSKCPPMRVGKFAQHAVVVDSNKICVFPDNLYMSLFGWHYPNFEVFHPTDDGGFWSYLPEPFTPRNPCDSRILLYCVLGSKLHISTVDGVFIIDVNNPDEHWKSFGVKTWVDYPFPPFSRYGAVLDNMCFFSPTEVFAIPHSDNADPEFPFLSVHGLSRRRILNAFRLNDPTVRLHGWTFTPLGDGKLCIFNVWTDQEYQEGQEGQEDRVLPLFLEARVLTFETKVASPPTIPSIGCPISGEVLYYVKSQLCTYSLPGPVYDPKSYMPVFRCFPVSL